MSRIKTAVLDVLSDGRWHQASEIFEVVCKRCRTNRTNVANVINTLSGGHHLIKEHIPGSRYNSCRYRLADLQAGFGINPVVADFNQLLKSVRGHHATN